MNLNPNARRFIQIIDKIPMFQGLNAPQALEILKLCRPRSLGAHSILMEHGTRPTEMFILLAGKLAVTTRDGTRLTELLPIQIVGEMGIVTGQPRTATVIVEQAASVFEITKLKFDILMKKSPEIGFKIFRNIILILSERLNNNNIQLARSQRELAQMRDKLAALPAV